MTRRPWLLMMLILTLLIGCNGQPAPVPAAPAEFNGETFQIALPRLVIDFDAQGVPSVLGINPLILKGLGVDVAGLQLPAETIALAQKRGIQHIELAAVGDRLVIFMNGAPLPILRWDDAALQRLLDLGRLFEVKNIDTIAKLAPWLTRLGLDVALRFPHAGDAIPLAEAGSAKALALTPYAGDPGAIIKFELRFDDEGVPAILSLSARDLAAMGVSGMRRLAPDALAKLQKQNIQHIEFRTKAEGMLVYINGEPLPAIFWDSALLANLVTVWGQLTPDSPYQPLIEAIVPTLDRSDVDAMLHFPASAGQTPITTSMHD